MSEEVKKQSITGFKVINYNSKRTKAGQKFRVVIEAEVDEIKTGDYDMGDFQKALLHHQDSEIEVGLNVFIKK